MSVYTGELFPSYNAVDARREWEIGMIKEKIGKGEMVDTAVCRVERASADDNTVRFGLKRGKLLYLFKYPTHDVEREKHRNVITRARFIKNALELAGYRLIPWDFKKGKPPTFWDKEEIMDDGEDDDLYGPSEPATTYAEPKKEPVKDESDSDDGDEPMDEGLESGEEEESDSDLEIIIDRPETASKPPTHDKPPAESKAIKIEQPPQTSITQSKQSSTTPSATLLPHQQGTAYPAVRTSTIDVNADPVYPPAGKTISQIDMDADLAESSKPWRLPGADQSDYFNYGFDEFTWEMYRQRQASVTSALQTQKAETAQFQQMFMPGMPAPGVPAGPAAGAGAGGSGGPGVPGAPTGPAAQTGGPAAAMGMPPGMNEEQMAMMFAQMQGSGMDMSNLDFTAFMQMAGGGGMPGFPQQQGGGGGGGQFGGVGGQGAQGGAGGGGGGRGSGRRGGRW